MNKIGNHMQNHGQNDVSQTTDIIEIDIIENDIVETDIIENNDTEHTQNQPVWLSIDYVPVQEKYDKNQIIHHDDFSQNVILNDEQLPITINPELVNSKEQVYQLRQTLQQWICGESTQYLTAFHPIERARQITGLLAYVLNTQYRKKVLIVSHQTQMLAEVEQAFLLHTEIQPSYLIQDLKSNPKNKAEILFDKSVYLVRYQDFLAEYEQKAELENVFCQFDLLVIDEPELEQNQLWQVIMQKYYRNWRWYIHLELPPQIIVA